MAGTAAAWLPRFTSQIATVASADARVRRHQRRLEVLEGNLSAFFHGCRLGLTIGVLGSLLALAWYLLAPEADHP